ncbi:serine protease [Kitasatospora acidiphila]|uniref:Serine protease n=1 Tax=Kitasatospora acidiphila TaxID=2567942 RepID=A0A540W9W1_9ACTN|nr:serine protease [Kitasatospora acidiphila]TQF05820.1 serine protease [Kitasatospora acidiphila]
MSVLSKHRIVFVHAARQGSGYLLTRRLILTSAHVVVGDQVSVAVPGQTGLHPCSVVWRRLDDQCDGALLLSSTDLIEAGEHLAQMAWGTTDDLSAVPGCEAVGFPAVARNSQALPDTEQLVGTLKPGSSILRGRYVLDSAHSSPPSTATGSPWAGMSGAAVFARSALVGVVSGDPTNWAHGRVEAVPASSLLADPAFVQLLTEHAGTPPVLASIHAEQSDAAGSSFVRMAVSDSVARDFGMHPLAEIESLPTQLPYIPRLIDSELDRKLAAIAPTGGLLIATGDSAAGKSRSMFEAMKRLFPAHQVYIPEPDADLRQLIPLLSRGTAGSAVLWLDEIHLFLRPDGLTSTTLAGLQQARVVVLGTLRSEYVDFLSQPPDVDNGGRQIAGGTSSAWLILRRAATIEIKRQWEDPEREAAAALSDPRVREALRADRAHGLAEYLASGPQVLQRWKRAVRAGGHPRGAALVAASIDLARTGLDVASPADSIERLHEHYLDAYGGPALRPEPLQKAWEWASAIVLGVTSPLIPATGQRWRPFDYLVSDVARNNDPKTIPDLVWHEALSLVDEKRRDVVMLVAQAARRYDIAATLWRTEATQGNPDGMINLGAMLVRLGQTDEAAQWFEKAADCGDPMGAHNAGVLAQENGELESAQAWFQRAIDAGLEQSRAPLGLVLERLGDEDGAAAQWRIGSEHGDAASAFSYSHWLRSKWESDEALAALRVAADAGLPIAMLSYAGTLLIRQDPESANDYLVRAYDLAVREARLGDAVQAGIAGLIANAIQDTDGATHWWELAQADGYSAPWQIIHGHEGALGLSRIAIDDTTLAKLGPEEVQLLMSTLWAGDCFDCGFPLGESIPALQVTDDYTGGRANLYHLAVCRYPRWNDSALQEFTRNAGLNWRSHSAAVPDHDGVLRPALIVNPRLEQSSLTLDGDTWRMVGSADPWNHALSSGAAPLWKAQIPTVAPDRLAVHFSSTEIAVRYAVEVWSAGLTPMLRALIQQQAGFLLIMTSGLGPDEDGVEAVRMAIESFDAVQVWVPLE